MTIHDLTWWKYPAAASNLGRRYYRPLAERAIKNGCEIATVSEAVAREIRQHFDVKQVHVVSPVPKILDRNQPAWKLESGKPYIVAIGTVEPRKNLARLADAFSKSRSAEFAELVIVGRMGWGRQPPGVTVLSGLSDGQLAAVLIGAQALFLPSLYEGFGLPLVEAQLLGVPVFCSDLVVFHEVAGSNATFFSPTDVKVMAQYVDRAFHQTDRGGPAIESAYGRDRTSTEIVRMLEGPGAGV